jgi:hypothetical protein
VLDGAVLVDVARHTERRQKLHLVSVSDRTAEDQDRNLPIIKLANRSNQVDPAGVGQPQVDEQEVNPVPIGAHTCQQFCRALHRHRMVAGREERIREPVADKRRIVSDQNGFGGHVALQNVSGSAYNPYSAHAARPEEYVWQPARSATLISMSMRVMSRRATRSIAPNAARASS